MICNLSIKKLYWLISSIGCGCRSKIKINKWLNEMINGHWCVIICTPFENRWKFLEQSRNINYYWNLKYGYQIRLATLSLTTKFQYHIRVWASNVFRIFLKENKTIWALSIEHDAYIILENSILKTNGKGNSFQQSNDLMKMICNARERWNNLGLFYMESINYHKYILCTVYTVHHIHWF